MEKFPTTRREVIGALKDFTFKQVAYSSDLGRIFVEVSNMDGDDNDARRPTVTFLVEKNGKQFKRASLREALGELGVPCKE